MAEFLAFQKARAAAAADDNDPDNGRDIVLQKGDQVLTIPYRMAKQFDLESFLSGTFGIKRKAAPAGKGGDGGDGDGKQGTQGDGKPTNVRQFFTGGSGKAASGGTGS